jgi:Arm DNA-binding domain
MDGKVCNLTDRKVRSLKRDEKRGDKLGHYDIWDALVPGLGVRTSATGRRTFVLVARYPGSRNPTRRSLGVYGQLTLEQARKKARDWLELIREARSRPTSALPLWVQPVSATPLIVYRLEFRSPRSFADVD